MGPRALLGQDSSLLAALTLALDLGDPQHLGETGWAWILDRSGGPFPSCELDRHQGPHTTHTALHTEGIQLHFITVITKFFIKWGEQLPHSTIVQIHAKL